MRSFENNLFEILKSSKLLKLEDLEQAYQSSIEQNRPFSDILIFRGLLSEEVLGQLIADFLKVPFVSLRNKLIPDGILSLVPENLARHFRMIPFEKSEEKGIFLAMEDPGNLEALEIVKKRTGLKVVPYLVSKADLYKALNQYKRDIKKKFESIISENIKKASAVSDVSLEKLLQVAQDLPVVKILDAVLEYAAAENASDLHLETLADELLVRLRIDGVLHDIIGLPCEIQPAIIARIKVLSNLKIDEHRVPQDGRFKFQIDETIIALRVSIIPAFYGENVVLRLLPESTRPLSLEELGISGRNLGILRANIGKPHGMILVTGPTGCGKTTTLYSVLNILNTPKVKICTIEDPIEYGINRVNQIQVNVKTNLTFAAGLRSLLRHDPDIIMVGEIRDHETVNISIHSALTGHLVLSTLHTNDAASTIPRFLDMGAEGYLLASTLNLSIAQRLVRRICPSCISDFKPQDELIEDLSRMSGRKIIKQKFYKGKGCDKCKDLGYRGRVGIYEMMPISENIIKLVLQKASTAEIRKQAVSDGMVSMLLDGLDKIGAGLTTIDEVLAAVRE